MKGFTKICMIICLLLTCLSFVCFGAGAALGSGLGEVYAMAEQGAFDIGSWHIGKWSVFYNPLNDGIQFEKIISGIVEEEYPQEAAESLKIDVQYGKVKLVDSKSDQITVTVDAPKRSRYSCKLKGKTLTLIDKTSWNIWNLSSKWGNKAEITIAIPEGKSFQEVTLMTDAGIMKLSHHILAENIEIEIAAGELTAESITAEQELSADVAAGKLIVEDFSAKSLIVDCDVGAADLCGKVSGDVQGKCGVGEIFLGLTGREEDYDYAISCDLGSVHLNGRSISGMGQDTTIDNGKGNEIELECGVGEIEVTVEEE